MSRISTNCSMQHSDESIVLEIYNPEQKIKEQEITVSNPGYSKVVPALDASSLELTNMKDKPSRLYGTAELCRIVTSDEKLQDQDSDITNNLLWGEAGLFK